MRHLTIDLHEDIFDRVFDGVAKANRYEAQIPNSDYDSMYPDRGEKLIDNPETRDDFVKKIVKGFLMQSVQKAESDAARDAATKTAIAEVIL